MNPGFNTLIELFDECPLDNVLATEMFRPEKTVFMCPPEVSSEHKKLMREYFASRGVKTKLEFISTSLLSADSLEKALRKVFSDNPSCALNISGGSDAALFAAGRFSSDNSIPVFTYASRQNVFYNIRYAPFAHKCPCTVKLTVKDCFLMAGGKMRGGRTNEALLLKNEKLIEPLFDIFLRYKSVWVKFTSYIQRVSARDEESRKLSVYGPYSVKGEKGSVLTANEALLKELNEAGIIRKLSIIPGEKVSFDFINEQTRFWLRDPGSALEVYTWLCCRESGIFDEVKTSVIADWNGDKTRDAVYNELDVMAVKGVRPFFISCKTSEVDTAALNELAILKDRFGGKIAKAAIVTSRAGSSSARNRASELSISFINIDSLKNKKAFTERLKALCEDMT